MELAPPARQREFDLNGNPLAGGKLYTYEAGTSTPKATYQDRIGTANANPIILDSEGRYDLWLDSGYYKLVLKDSAGNLIWTKDQVSLPDEAALASAFWRDVQYVTSADSPLTLTQTNNGKLLSVDASGGAVVINLPQISLTSLPYNIGFKLTNATNTLTINRAGTDTIEGATSKVVSTTNASCQLIADIDKSPDQWAQLDFGVVDFSGYPTVTVASNDYVMIVDTSASSTNKKVLASDFSLARSTYRSVTTTDSVLTSDEVMKLSGASFTSTLPTAVGVDGKRYTYIHAGTNFTQVYTLATTSAQTIGGIASGSFALYTNGETLSLVSDGANWQIVSHKAVTPWIDGGTNTITATTTTGTAGTKSRDKVFYRRNGQNMDVRIEFVQTAGGSAGSGDYLFAIPASQTVDTAFVQTFASIGTNVQVSNGLGPCFVTTNSPATIAGVVALYDSTHVRLITSSGTVSAGAFGYTTTNVSYAATYSAPITGWQP
jgi:hypothetical protein